MNRTGLLVTLAIAAVVGVIFGFYPDLDLKVAALFFDPKHGNYELRQSLIVFRDGGMWLVGILVAPAVIALAVKLVFPRARFIMSARAAIFLAATLALGPGLLVNAILKDHWPRSRPIDVRPLGGADRFVAWWDPRGDCPKNCSFVSGDISAAIWTIAPAALAPPAWRPLAYGAALAFTAGISFQRMVLGGHFITDIVFAGVFTFLIIWLMHGLLYRWGAMRFSDEAIERAFARIARPRAQFPPREPELQQAQASKAERRS